MPGPSQLLNDAAWLFSNLSVVFSRRVRNPRHLPMPPLRQLQRRSENGSNRPLDCFSDWRRAADILSEPSEPGFIAELASLRVQLAAAARKT